MSTKLFSFMSQRSLSFQSSSNLFSSSNSRTTFSLMRKKIFDTIDNTNDSEEKSKSFMETLRLKCKSFYFHTFWGRLYDQIMLFMSILSSLQYIYNTYVGTVIDDRDGSQGNVLVQLELIISLACAVDWFINLFIADHRGLFFMSFFSWIDIVTVVSTLSTYNETCPLLRFSNTSREDLLYVLCGLNTTRILRALKFQKRFERIEDEVQRFLATMALNIVIMILFNSALMLYLETDQGLLFHTWTYYMLVTVTTVGYGDITPQSILGRLAAMGMICFAIITVPQMTNELIEKMNKQSIYARARYIPKTVTTKHVIVCGDLTATSLSEFLAELFHPDHDIDNLHCIILQSGFPSKSMLTLLKSTTYILSLTYLEGNPMNDYDLARALASHARAIFVMTNKFSKHADEEDCKTILQQFAFQRYLRLNRHLRHNNNNSNQRNKTLFILQLIRPENKRHLVSNSSNHAMMMSTLSDTNTNNKNQETKDNNNDKDDGNLVVCLNEIKMGIIAKAILFPGANTLIMNLLTSFSDETTSLLLEENNKKQKEYEGIETLEEDEDSGDWCGEYQRGCDWEIYCSELSDSFEGTKFCYISELLYQKLGIVLFGLEVEEIVTNNSTNDKYTAFAHHHHQQQQKRQIFLNPAEFIIPSKTECKVIAFVMAKNKAQSDLTFSGKGGAGGDQSFFGKASSSSSSAGGVNISPEINIFQTNISQLSALSKAFTNRLPGLYNNNQHNTSAVAATSAKEEEATATSKSMKEKEKEALLAANNNNNKRPQEWQVLLSKYQNKKSFQTMQEEMQREEDRILREYFFLRDANNGGNANNNSGNSNGNKDVFYELQDSYIQTSLSEEIPMVENHIIIVAKTLNNIYDLIRPLRARNLGILKHIVILYPYDFPIAVWQRIRIFESIWIVRGSALEEADIRRCGIFKAKQVILLADANSGIGSFGDANDNNTNSANGNGNNQGLPSSTLDTLVDADIIFCFQAIKRLNENAHIVVEIIRHSNVRYLDIESGLNSSDIDYKFTPQFASGSLFATSVLDTLVCQAFYNTKIIDVLHQMIGGQVHDQQKPTTSSSSSLASKGLIGSALYQINLPEGLNTRTYGALFRLLTRRNQIPLGILRGVFAHTKSGPKGNKMPYVFTNPPKDTELFSCDKIFVLSQSPIKITRIVKDETRELSLFSSIRARKKTTEDILNSVNILREEMKGYQIREEVLETQYHQYHVETQEKIQQMITSLSTTVANRQQQQATMMRTRSRSRSTSGRGSNGTAEEMNGSGNHNNRTRTSSSSSSSSAMRKSGSNGGHRQSHPAAGITTSGSTVSAPPTTSSPKARAKNSSS